MIPLIVFATKAFKVFLIFLVANCVVVTNNCEFFSQCHLCNFLGEREREETGCRCKDRLAKTSGQSWHG